MRDVDELFGVVIESCAKLRVRDGCKGENTTLYNGCKGENKSIWAWNFF